MAIALTGTGGLFTRLGKIFGYIRHIQGHRAEGAAVGKLNTGYVKYVDVAAATTTGKATQLDLTAPAAMSGIVQPDIPRNLIYNITDANSSLSVVSIVAVGTGPDGAAVTETVTSLTDYTGLKIFASITSITVATATGAGAGDLLDIGHGDKFGVPTPTDSTGLTITALTVDGVADTVAATDTTNRSFTATTLANGTRDYVVTYSWTATDAAWGAVGGPKIKDLTTGIDEITAQYASSLQRLTDSLYSAKTSFGDSQRGMIDTLTTLAQNTVIEMAHADAVLVSKDLVTALRELIRQMDNTSDTIDANTVTASVAAASGNTGTGKIIVGVIDGKGHTLEYAHPETLELKVVADSQGGGTAGAESFTLRGEVPSESRMAYTWPDGSGASTTLTMIDPTVDGSGAESDSSNMLTNSCFDAFTTNTPDDWTVLVGAAGTDILEEASTIYRTGGKSLEFEGDGATLPAIAQTLNPYLAVSTAENVIEPNTVYALAFYARKSASLVGGVLEISLVNGSNTIITDDEGNDLKYQVAHGTLTTSFAGYGTTFSTPRVLPATVKIRVRLSTAGTNNESVFVDDLALCRAVPAYTGGPFVAAFRGSTEAILDDQWNITVSNNMSMTSNDGGVFQTMFDAAFDMKGLQLQIPSHSSGSETIADTLVS